MPSKAYTKHSKASNILDFTQVRASVQILFQVISDSYERRSVILTTNIELSRRVGIFYDEQMTAAMIDRLVHHSYLLLFDGQSNRVRDSLMKSAG